MKKKLIEKVPYMGASEECFPDDAVAYNMIGRAGAFSVDGVQHLIFETTAKATLVMEKMEKAAPYMTDKTLEYIHGVADALLLQHEPDDPENDGPENTDKKTA